MTDRIIAPYGSWPSPLSAAEVASSSTPYADLQADGDTVYWLQGDPNLGGRMAVMRALPDGSIEQLTPDDFNARTAVHEYGGGALGAGHGVALASNWADQRVYRVDAGSPVPVTPEPGEPNGYRWADMAVLPGGGSFVAVRESHGDDRPRENDNIHGDPEAVNEVVRVDLATGKQTVLVTGPDFVGCVRPNAAGDRLAWIQWNHPDMPWDSAELWIADLGDHGVANAQHIAGGRDDAGRSSVCDAMWDAETLVFSGDSTGWWNIKTLRLDGEVFQLHNEPVDAGVPRWIHGSHFLASEIPGNIAAATYANGFASVRSAGGKVLSPPELNHVMAVVSTPSGLVTMAGGPSTPTGVFRLGWAEGPTPTAQRLSGSAEGATDALDAVAMPEPIEFPTAGGATAYGLYYPPTSATHIGPDDESPPLVVLTHGGPTALARTTINPTAQYWASRGLAVVDVNYRGSSPGYGREFRDALQNNWGIHDVADCVAATNHLVERGLADPERLIIEGGSAGGYTTLLALCTTDQFAVGGCSYGVSDLTALAKHTHKFESRYLDGLIGRWPEDEHIYVERSPLTHVDRLETPMIVLQGDEDKVVPPEQSEAIVEVLRDKGIAHEYLLFEGEQHGFRKAPNIARALEARLEFYGRILGFTPA